MSWISVSVRPSPTDPNLIIAQAHFGSWGNGARYERCLADVSVDKRSLPAGDATTVAWVALSAIMDELVKRPGVAPTQAE